MIFDGVDMLNDIVRYGRHNGRFKDEEAPEVDRYYNSSPPLMEHANTYQMDSMFKSDEKVCVCVCFCVC